MVIQMQRAIVCDSTCGRWFNCGVLVKDRCELCVANIGKIINRRINGTGLHEKPILTRSVFFQV
jgi:hypothetical protein